MAAVLAGAARLAERQRRAGYRRGAGWRSRPSGASAAGRRPLALLAVGNAPWLVSGLLHAADATTDPAGASAFALHAEGVLPAPVAALGLGGIWNAEVVPASRDGLLGWLSVLALLGLAAAGLRGLRAHLGRRDQLALIGCVAAAWLAAVLTWAAPSAMSWTVAHVPGAGLLRDGTRILAVAAPGLALAVGHGAARLTAALRRAAPAAPATAGLALVAWPWCCCRWRCSRTSASGSPGGSAQSATPTDTPAPARWSRPVRTSGPAATWSCCRSAATDSRVEPGPQGARPHRGAISLPTTWRPTTCWCPAYGSRGRTREPAPPFAPWPVPPRRPGVGALAALGIRFAVTDLDVPGAPRVAGRALMPETGRIQVQELAGVRVRIVPSGWRVAMALAWAAYIAMLGVGGFVGVRRITASRLRGGGRPAG